MSARWNGAAAALAMLGLCPEARAQGCLSSVLADRQAYPDRLPAVRRPRSSPIALGPDGTDFGTTPSACGGNRIQIDGRADLTVDVPEFYGAITLDGTVRGGFQLGGDGLSSRQPFVTLSLTPVAYRFAQNASLAATRVTLGGATVALHLPLAGRLRTSRNAGETVYLGYSATGFLRVLLPTDLGFTYGWRAGVEPGVSTASALGPRVTLHTGASLPLALTGLQAQAALVRWNPRLDMDLLWSPFAWLELGAGVELRGRVDADGVALEALTPKVTVRFSQAVRGLFAHLTAGVPVLGDDRALGRALAGAGWYF
ncbi:MAG: hypothetical protein HY909_10390 [Deltaproteobacteria bacterium]|nr:hypothetical protein [Deltaproteobacteria bacterium]